MRESRTLLGRLSFHNLACAQHMLCSRVPPAYYADLCAKRGHLYFNNLVLQDGWYTYDSGHIYEAAKLEWGFGVHDDIKQTMFYL
jgi:hypothetical protein